MLMIEKQFYIFDARKEFCVLSRKQFLRFHFSIKYFQEVSQTFSLYNFLEEFIALINLPHVERVMSDGGEDGNN